MVIVKLLGGLGNQMFQYAFGRSLALRNHADLSFDMSFFKEHPERPFQLDFFNIQGRPALEGELERHFSPFGTNLLSKMYRQWMRWIPTRFRAIVNEKGMDYDAEVGRNRSSHLYLNGYWQSWRYFADENEMLRSELTPAKELSPAARTLITEVEACDSVSLHVRRGDYASNPRVNQTHGLLPLAYYRSAVEWIGGRVSNPVFYVFSDDMPWVKANLDLPYTMIPVSTAFSLSDGEEMWVMSRCRHYIIANSSFSWWGAWLGQGDGRQVIAPRRWFADRETRLEDRIPPGWVVK